MLFWVGVVLVSLGFAVAQLKDAPYPFDVTTITAPDTSVTAKFVSLGATMVEFWVNDKHSESVDVIAGYDNSSLLLTDPVHPYFGPVVGRYANRIKNGTFSIPISADPSANATNTFHVSTNENNGADTLHGGFLGWDRREWTKVAQSKSSVTYSHFDAGDEGFPGNVTIFATFTLGSNELNIKFFATASEPTPVMASQHVYWNLNAFRTKSEHTADWNSSTILNHTLHLPTAGHYIASDSILVPTGEIIPVDGTALDFRKPNQIGARWDGVVGLCGAGCTGYDTAWIYDSSLNANGINGTTAGAQSAEPVTVLEGDLSGIRIEMFSDQPAVQVYSGNGMGTTPRKEVHGGSELVYGKNSAVVIEQEGWIDAVNSPQWNVDQIYEPGKNYVWDTTYRFSIVGR
ncbi:galactose mutarotase-like protein [Vararia minispora EC-137]|uniref:Galactose mutarotase-like protein n=1 Tax=Vararia minispora EC-137 TaxID=1314806 RepID=A0ACB8QJF5_9AGAM|nr:galactose mutarotase-like protein [Vararia minispora EC-137]